MRQLINTAVVVICGVLGGCHQHSSVVSATPSINTSDKTILPTSVPTDAQNEQKPVPVQACVADGNMTPDLQVAYTAVQNHDYTQALQSLDVVVRNDADLQHRAQAWLSVATIRLTVDALYDAVKAEDALAELKKLAAAGVQLSVQDHLQDSALTQLARAKRSTFEARNENKRLQVELDKKEATVKKLRELTLGR